MLITGNIKAVKNIDIWVNSENTNMQMASYFDRSISGTIRYYGAKRDKVSNHVVEDTINKELVEKMAGNFSVASATVMETGSGELEKSNHVKKIFHVASVYGTPAHGYSPVPNIAECVRNALEEADSPRLAELKLQSILFPILGTGQGGGDLKPTVQSLMEVALTYLENHPESNINSVSFLARFDDRLAACQEILNTYKPQRLVTD